jgi:hypothetical protein
MFEADRVYGGHKVALVGAPVIHRDVAVARPASLLAPTSKFLKSRGLIHGATTPRAYNDHERAAGCHYQRRLGSFAGLDTAPRTEVLGLRLRLAIHTCDQDSDSRRSVTEFPPNLRFIPTVIGVVADEIDQYRT